MQGNDIKKRLAENLKRIRKECNLTQEKLAEKAGLSLDTIRLVETCKRWPREDNLASIATALEADIGELFLTSEIPAKNSATRMFHAKITTLRKKINSALDELA